MRTWHIAALAATLTALNALYWLAPTPDRPWAQPWADEATFDDLGQLAQLAGRVGEAEARWALQVVDPHGQLEPYFGIERGQAWLRREATAPVSLVIPLAPESPASPAPSRPEEDGLKVLIDPGHFGGAWARTEHRNVVVGSLPPIREGDLTWGVARRLQELLARTGAATQLTRDPPPDLPFPQGVAATYDAERELAYMMGELRGELQHRWWWRFHPSRLTGVMLGGVGRELQQDAFVLYRRFHLRQRAEVSLGWQPDVTLSIHFNAAGPGGRNGVMAFVPGHFMPGELATWGARRDAIRRILDGTLPHALALARVISGHMQRQFGLGALPFVPLKPDAVKQTLDPNNGIFARNLALLRRSYGVALLLEGPCVDQPEEAQRLSGREISVDGGRYPRRVEEYAQALAAAIDEQASVIRSWRRPPLLDSSATRAKNAPP